MPARHYHWFESAQFAGVVTGLRDSSVAANGFIVQGRRQFQESSAILRGLLLEHPGPLEPEGYCGSVERPEPLLASLGTSECFSNATWAKMPEAPQTMLELMRMAAQKGANVSVHTYAGVPLVNWVAMRGCQDGMNTAPAVALLIDLGADVHALPSAPPSTLVEMARFHSGPEGAALVSEALMRRRIALEAGIPSEGASAKPARRRATI